MNDYLTEILTCLCLDTHIQPHFSALFVLSAQTTFQILSLPLGGRIMRLHSQIERQTWMKMIGTDNFA